MAFLFDIPRLLAEYGYIGIFIIVFLESGIFFALPGDSLLFTAGLFAPKFGFSVLVLIALVAVASFLGGIAGYIIGIYIHKLHRYAFFRKILKQESIDKAHDFFEKHGFVGITLARWVPVIRTFAPIAAGIARMNFYKFLRYSAISSIIWSVVFIDAGFYLGKRFPWIEGYISWYFIGVILVSCLPLAFEWYRRHRQGSADQTTL